MGQVYLRKLHFHLRLIKDLYIILCIHSSVIVGMASGLIKGRTSAETWSSTTVRE